MSQRQTGGGPYYASSSSAGQRYGSAADVRPYRGGAGASGRQAPPSPRISQPPLIPQAFTEALERLPPPNQWPSQVLSYLVVDPLLALFRFVLEMAINPRTHRIILRLSVLSALFWTALGLAIAGYVGFYRAWVPDIGLTRTVWLQYGYDRPPFADISLHGLNSAIGVFAEDQEYDVSLDLIVPLSAANLDLGNFMIALDLRSAQNSSVHHISKPWIIVHEPGPIRAMNNLMFQFTRNAPAFILPTSSPPVQLMTIPLLSRAVLEPARASHPFAATVPAGVVSAHITVGRADANKYWVYGGGHGVGGVLPETGGILKAASSYEGYRSRGELQTHSASLRFDAHLTGLRYFMYHHPLASFILFTSLFMGFELISALTLWAIAAFYTSSLTQPSLEIEDNFTGRYGGTSTDFDSTPRPSAGEEGYESETPTPESDAEQRRQQSRLAESSNLSSAQRQSLASLQARDTQEFYEQRRAEMLRDELEGRRMTAVDQPATGALDDLELTQGRRVLGRLDEETEEETDVHASETSAGWEDVGEEEGESGETDPLAGGIAADDPDLARIAALRRRTVKEEDGDDNTPFGRGQSTIGGSSTSRASSVRSFGATSLGTGITGSSVAPSRSQTQATPEIKEEYEEPETEDGDDTERDDNERS
ncbi:uncharacterized protein FA14DRAFT_160500 [Meira miltonrushii]|uniref:Adipose-regulatory protein-domain-containing protein n=1 Tax=Meira miltonrushii TaxID=1280837 RepID=A0A316VG38_9BASI|nr:uncharacterized protein FA14DRAFT_160500 [Meira miltonrushii]PWN35283.1 hypothetical protein FA14DRAFT_160500 [Meira miltonrushii]